jgi:hypothetical protein
MGRILVIRDLLLLLSTFLVELQDRGGWGEALHSFSLTHVYTHTNTQMTDETLIAFDLLLTKH